MKKIMILLHHSSEQEVILQYLDRQLQNDDYNYLIYYDAYELYQNHILNKAHILFVSYFLFQKNVSLLFFLDQLNIPLHLFYYHNNEVISFYQICKKTSSELLKIVEKVKTYFILNARDGNIKIYFSNILYLESNKMYVHIYTKDAIYKTRTQLNTVQKKLPANFLRCHQSFIVNASYVYSSKRNELQLLNGQKIPISKKYIKVIKDYFDH